MLSTLVFTRETTNASIHINVICCEAKEQDWLAEDEGEVMFSFLLVTQVFETEPFKQTNHTLVICGELRPWGQTHRDIYVRKKVNCEYIDCVCIELFSSVEHTVTFDAHGHYELWLHGKSCVLIFKFFITVPAQKYNLEWHEGIHNYIICRWTIILKVDNSISSIALRGGVFTWILLKHLLSLVQGLQHALSQVLVLPNHSVAIPDIHHLLSCKHTHTMSENPRLQVLPFVYTVLHKSGWSNSLLC